MKANRIKDMGLGSSSVADQERVRDLMTRRHEQVCSQQQQGTSASLVVTNISEKYSKINICVTGDIFFIYIL